MKSKKLTLGIIIFTFFFAFLVSFCWAWASFEPDGDIWTSFYKKLITLLPGPIGCLVFFSLFRKRKWWSQELK